MKEVFYKSRGYNKITWLYIFLLFFFNNFTEIQINFIGYNDFKYSISLSQWVDSKFFIDLVLRDFIANNFQCSIVFQPTAEYRILNTNIYFFG